MNICILSLKRSGTGYLTDVVKQNSWIEHLEFEPFFASMYGVGEPELKIIERLSRCENTVMKDIHFFNLQHLDEYKCMLAENYYVVKLIRDNVFDRTVSSQIAFENDVWNVYNIADDPIEPIVLDPAEFLDRYIEEKRRQKMLEEFDVYHDVIHYKNLTKVKRPYIPETVDYSKVTVKMKPKKDFVINYKELEQLVKEYENET